MKLLVVADDHRSGARLVGLLQSAGYLVDLAAFQEDGSASCSGRTYDAILLELSSSHADGLSLLRRRRSPHDRTPVIFVTAQEKLAHKLEAFENGADDYIVKPFEIDELLARIRVQIRHMDGRDTDIIQLSGVRVDLALRRVTRGDATVGLTAREYAVLASLVRRASGIVSKAELEEQLYDDTTQVESNTVEVAICALRRKLGRELIVTSRGLGYTVRPLAEKAAS